MALKKKKKELGRRISALDKLGGDNTRFHSVKIVTDLSSSIMSRFVLFYFVLFCCSVLFCFVLFYVMLPNACVLYFLCK